MNYVLSQSRFCCSFWYVWNQIPHSGLYYVGLFFMDDFGFLTELDKEKFKLV